MAKSTMDNIRPRPVSNGVNTTLTIKTPKKLRDEAKKTAGEMGIPLTIVMNTMLRQFVQDRRLVIEAECP